MGRRAKLLISLFLLVLLLTSLPRGVSADEAPTHGGRSMEVWAARLVEQDLEAALGAQDAFLAAGEPGVPALLGLLRSKEPYHRHVALHTLTLMGPDAATACDALTKILATDLPPLRLLAAEALGRIGPAAESALEGVQTFLDQESPYFAMVGEVAVRGIEEVAPFEAAEDPEIEGVRVSQWTWRLISPHPGLRRRAREALADQPAEIVLPWILRWWYREGAFIALTEPQWHRICGRQPTEAGARLRLGTEATAKTLLARAIELDDEAFDIGVLRLLWECGTDMTSNMDAFLEVAGEATGVTRYVAVSMLTYAAKPSAAAIPMLVDSLTAGGVETGRAAHVLGRLQAQAVDAVPALEKALEATSGDLAFVQQDIRLAIRRIQVGDEALIDGLADEERGVRSALLRAAEDEPFAPALRDRLIARALEDASFLVVQDACDWILDQGEPGEAALLEKASDPKLVKDILAAVSSELYRRQSEYDSGMPSYILQRDAWALDEGEEEETEEPRDLTAFLPVALGALDADYQTQSKAVEVIGRLGVAARKAAPELRAILASDDWLLHRKAAEALGAITAGTTEAIEELEGYLARSDKLVSLGAAEGLSLVGAPAVASIPAIVGCLREYARSDDGKAEAEFPYHHVDVIGEALALLARTGDEAVEAIAAFREDEHREVRWACVEALGGVGPTSDVVLEVLEKALRDEEESIAILAATKLVRMGEVDLARVSPSGCLYDQLDPFYRIVLHEFGRRAAEHPAVQIVQKAHVGADERMQRILREGIRKARDPLADLMGR